MNGSSKLALLTYNSHGRQASLLRHTHSNAFSFFSFLLFSMLNCLERYCLYSPVFSGTQVSVHIVSNTCEDCTRHSVVPQRFGPPPSSGGWPKLTLFHCVFRYGGEVQLQRQDLFLPVTHLWSTTQGGGPLESSICLKASMLHMRLSFFTMPPRCWDLCSIPCSYCFLII